MAGVEGGMWAAVRLGEHILAVQPICRLGRHSERHPTGWPTVPGETAHKRRSGREWLQKQGGQTAADQEEVMRLIDVVLISAVIGMILGLVQTGLPGARASGGLQVAASDCGRSMCERITWLRAPLLRRATSAE